MRNASRHRLSPIALSSLGLVIPVHYIYHIADLSCSWLDPDKCKVDHQ